MTDYSKVKIDKNIIDALATRLLRLDERKASEKTEAAVAEFKESILKETKDLGKNVFGLFQGVTHYTTHVRKTKEEKVFGNVLGEMAKMNSKAIAFCDALVY